MCVWKSWRWRRESNSRSLLCLLFACFACLPAWDVVDGGQVGREEREREAKQHFSLTLMLVLLHQHHRHHHIIGVRRRRRRRMREREGSSEYVCVCVCVQQVVVVVAVCFFSLFPCLQTRICCCCLLPSAVGADWCSVAGWLVSLPVDCSQGSHTQRIAAIFFVPR